jgi:hypothetical protein
MHTSIIQIAGRGVDVPHHELPQLIKQLTTLYQQIMLVTGDISAPPAEGFMTYEQAEEILSAHYAGKVLRYHTGRLWGAFCRVTMRDILKYETKCTLCEEPIAYRSHSSGECYHGLSTAVGYRLILIGAESLRTNFTAFMDLKISTIGPSIKGDYALVLGQVD